MVVVVCAPTRWFDVLPDATVNAYLVSLVTRQLAAARDPHTASNPAIANDMNPVRHIVIVRGALAPDFIEQNHAGQGSQPWNRSHSSQRRGHSDVGPSPTCQPKPCAPLSYRCISTGTPAARSAR